MWEARNSADFDELSRGELAEVHGEPIGLARSGSPQRPRLAIRGSRRYSL